MIYTHVYMRVCLYTSTHRPLSYIEQHASIPTYMQQTNGKKTHTHTHTQRYAQGPTRTNTHTHTLTHTYTLKMNEDPS